MSVTTSTTTTEPGVTVTLTNKVGLVLAALLGVADVLGPVTVPAPEPGETGPPMSVLIACAILGVITLIAVVVAWRSGSRLGSRVVAGTRILSAVTTLPAFFGDTVPAGLIAFAAILVILTLVSVYLVLARPTSRA